jgi:hypothetical protein
VNLREACAVGPNRRWSAFLRRTSAELKTRDIIVIHGWKHFGNTPRRNVPERQCKGSPIPKTIISRRSPAGRIWLFD